MVSNRLVSLYCLLRRAEIGGTRRQGIKNTPTRQPEKAAREHGGDPSSGCKIGRRLRRRPPTSQRRPQRSRRSPELHQAARAGQTAPHSEAEFAEPGVAHGDRLAEIRHAICCARRSAPSAAAAPRSPHAIVRSILSPDPRFVTTPKIDDVGSRREPVSPQHRSPERHRQPLTPMSHSEAAAGAGRSGHADARRTPRRRGGVVSAPDRFSSHFNSASRVGTRRAPARACVGSEGG